MLRWWWHMTVALHFHLSPSLTMNPIRILPVSVSAGLGKLQATYFDGTLDTSLLTSLVGSKSSSNAGTEVSQRSFFAIVTAGLRMRLHTMWKEWPHFPITVIRSVQVTVSRLRVHTESTIIARIFARRTSSIELNATNTTDFIFRHIPPPGSDCVPLFDSDLHFDRASSMRLCNCRWWLQRACVSE